MAAQTLAPAAGEHIQTLAALDAIGNANDGLLALEAVEAMLYADAPEDLHLVQRAHLACLLGILRGHIGAHMREAKQLVSNHRAQGGAA